MRYSVKYRSVINRFSITNQDATPYFLLTFLITEFVLQQCFNHGSKLFGGKPLEVSPGDPG